MVDRGEHIHIPDLGRYPAHEVFRTRHMARRMRTGVIIVMFVVLFFVLAYQSVPVGNAVTTAVNTANNAFQNAFQHKIWKR